MRSVCVGDSHTHAIAKGAAILGIDLPTLRRRENKKDKRPTQERWGEVEDELTRLQPERLLCCIGGGSVAVLGLGQHPERFDFALPWRPDLAIASDAQTIPYGAMRALMEAHVKRHLVFLTRLLRFRIPMIQFETPPPIFDNAVLAAMAARAINGGRDSSAASARLGISDPSLRYKIWSLHSRVFEDFCRAKGIGFVKNPPEALDENGFLARECWGDFVHGNAEYGAMVLRNLGVT